MDDYGLKALTFDRFDGGMTDNYIDAPVNKFERAGNLLLTDAAKLRTRFGSEILDSTYYQIPPGAQRIGAIHDFDLGETVSGSHVLLQQSSRNLYFVNFELPAAFYANIGIPTPPFIAGWKTLLGPTGNPAIPSGDTTNHLCIAEWNKHVLMTTDAYGSPMKVYLDGELGSMTVRNAYVPAVDTSGVSAAGAAGTNTYLYALVYYVGYMADQTFRVERGPVQILDQVTCAEPGPGAQKVTLSVLPVLDGALTENWNTLSTGSAPVILEIYRTQNGGTEFRKVGQIFNGDIAGAGFLYEDTTDDTQWELAEEILYTDGGVLENMPPPECKFVTVVGDTAYYANIRIDIAPTGAPSASYYYFKNRFQQSVPGNPTAVLEDAFDDLDAEITAIGSTGTVAVLFCENKIYRVEGKKFNDGSGSINKEIVSDRLGCVSQGSVVQIPNGILFAGHDGFYFTDGYRAQKISTGLEVTFKSMLNTSTKRKRIRGTFDKENNRVYWAMQLEADSTDNDCVFVLDLRWGLREDSTFTYLVGENDSFSPTALCMFGGDFLRADRRGYVFRHDDQLLADPKVNVAANPSLWDKSTIVYEYRGPATHFGLPDVRKWVPAVNVTADDETNVALQIYSINDDSGDERPLTEIKLNSKITWGDADVLWGDPEIQWNYVGMIMERRTFPARSLRCLYKQLVITNAETIAGKSDLLGTATVDPVGKTALLDGAASFDWPTDAVDYKLYFENDGYTKSYPVTVRTDDTLTFSDSAGTAPSGSYKWILKGKRKNEVLNLVNYSILFKPITRSIHTYDGNSGGNT